MKKGIIILLVLIFTVSWAFAFNPPQDVVVDEVTGTISWTEPASSAIYWLDDMDSYTAGEYLALQSDDWTTWSGSPGGSEDGYVVDELAFSGLNSVKVEGSTTDLVHEFGLFTSGVYEVSMMMYIEPGYGGYYNLLHFFNGASSEWGMEVYFSSSGTGDLCATMQNVITFSHPVGSWFEVLCIIDLDADWAEYYVDGVFVYEWQWSIDTVGVPGSCEFGAIDIFAYAPVGDTPMFYCDDVMINEVITRDLSGYNVYLDDMVTPIASVGTDVFEFTYESLVNGQEYIAGVSAVYDDPGESEIIEVTFIYEGTNAGNVIVAATQLNSNYPNPFNPVTNISYSIVETGNVTIEVYNLRSQLVKTLVNDVKGTGDYTATWDGTDNSNKLVSSGVYFYKMKTSNYTATKKMILMK
ncbi:MAG: T9SS type A sorting domain-containing protein [Candidatus Cloacimonetes bacterium]|nr:T9SS type A sorting domain-containing protein [Candidatus Cloacimonadota bacterium]